MALSRNYKLCLSLAIFFFSLTFMPHKSGGIEASINEEELRKMILGSRPPGCVNKCMSCRPCEATLVIPPHLHNMIKNNNSPIYYHKLLLSHRDQEGSYYLLSWKCRCGNKLYQP